MRIAEGRIRELIDPTAASSRWNLTFRLGRGEGSPGPERLPAARARPSGERLCDLLSSPSNLN